VTQSGPSHEVWTQDHDVLMAMVEFIDECDALSRRVEIPTDSIFVEANTLGDALKQIESSLGVRFSPFQGDESFDGGQYFIVDPPIPGPPISLTRLFRILMLAPGARPRPWEIPCLPKNCVDVHILRGEREVCPKQDLSFELINGDKVIFPLFIC
jgi:hypothetical protein